MEECRVMDFKLKVNVLVLTTCLLITTAGQNFTGELLYSCDYSIDLCGAQTDFWRRADGPAAGRPSSGPLTGAGNETGYLYFPSANCSQPGDRHDVVIKFSNRPPDTYLSKCCLLFGSHVWGPDVGYLDVRHVGAGSTTATSVWRLASSFGDRWRRTEVTLDNCGTTIVLSGGCGGPGHSDLAVDDVVVYAQPCPGIQVLPYYCGFEDDNTLCDFHQPSADGADWRRVTSPSPYRNGTRLTGPETGSRMTSSELGTTVSVGPTTNTADHFMLMYAPDVTDSAPEVLLTFPLLNASTSCCVAFKYYMYGDGTRLGSLEVSVSSLRFRRRYSVRDSWSVGKVSLLGKCRGSVEFRAKRGSSATDLMDIAIDEVWVIPGACVGENSDSVTDGSYHCDFDETYCGLIQINEGADWLIHRGESLSRAAGADTGPTAETTWSYLYLSAYEQQDGYRTAAVHLPTLRAPSSACIEFDYYMSGSAVQQLSLYTTHAVSPRINVVREIFVQNYDMGRRWRHYSGTLDLSGSNYLLTIEGITSAKTDSDLALTNITITPNPCAVDLGSLGPLPWSCDFEDDDDDDFWCRLKQTRLDDSNQGWRKSSVIPARRDLGIGPRADHTNASLTGKMMYFSTTLTYGQSKVGMRLPRAVFDSNATEYLCLSFHYYMRGPSFSQLVLFYDTGAYTIDRLTHIWHQTYDQGDLWRSENLTLKASLSLPVMIAAKSLVDGGGSDVAVDDMSLTAGGCEQPTNEQDFLPYECDFEFGWCNMQQDYDVDIDWRWHSGIGLSRAKGYYTGPTTDATSSIDGHYAYYQSSLVTDASVSVALTTPKLKLPNSTVCLSFRYHMYGKDVGMLRLDQLIPYAAETGYELYTTIYLWHASFAFPDQWYSYMRTFEDFTGKVMFSARNYYSYAPQGDMAIDNISIRNGTCQENLDVYSGSLPFVCDFEATICNFKQFISGTDSSDYGDFRWQGGISVSRKEDLDTGPLFDATYNTTLFVDVDIYSYRNLTICEDLFSMNTTRDLPLNATNCVDLPKAYYIYFRQRDHTLGTSQFYIIASPIMQIGNVTVCLSFRYHMFGYDVNRLTILNKRLDGSADYLWHQRYDHGDTWWTTRRTVAGMQGRILFRVDGGSRPLADVAIDDVTLTNGSCDPETGVTRIPLPWSCHFEADFCDVVHEFVSDDDEWRWQRGQSRSRTESELTGPRYDATFGNTSGHYALFDASDTYRSGQFSFLKTPLFNYSTSVPAACLSFKYHCYGYAVGSLWLYIDRTGLGEDMQYLWHTSYTLSDDWYAYSRTIEQFRGQLVFKGVRGPGVDGDLAVDDILITGAACTEAVGDFLRNVTYSCDFESSYCDMQQAIDDRFEWRRHRDVPGPPSATYRTFSGETGAREDHTNGTTNGFSLHLQSYYADGSLWYSEISTPKFKANKPTVCVDFYYHMYGFDVYLLELYWAPDLTNDTIRSYVWHQAYDQDDEWFHFYRTIADFEGRLVFVGHSGWSRLSYIELDDLSIYPAPCKDPEVLSMPLYCPFEHGFCFLEQNRHNDTGDFHRPKGKSLARRNGYDTGPVVDHTYECNRTDGKYVYLYKARCPDCAGSSAMLDSLMVNVSGQSVVCLQFWYYMYGATVDSLRWSVIQNDGRTVDVWSSSGDLGEDWDLVQLNVTVSGTAIRFRLEGIYGTGLDSDVALDDLSIYGGPCRPVPECDMAPPPVARSTVTIEGISYGDLANYTCDIGYRFPGGKRWDVLVCDNAQWRCPLPDCEIIHCEQLPTRPHLQWSSRNTEWNTTVEVTCDTYYTLSDPLNNAVTCLDTQQWDKNISTIYCNLTRCPEIPQVYNAVWIPSRNNTVTSHIELKCYDNYTLINANFSKFVCLTNGQWDRNISLAGCRPIACPELPVLADLSWDTNETFYQTVVHPLCDEYHKPSNESFSLTCLADETWNNSTAIEDSISCVPKRCPVLPTLPQLEWNTNDTLYNTTVRPVCNGLYRLSNPTYALHCNLDENWNNTNPIADEIACELISCPDLPIIQNGNWSTLNTSVSTDVRPSCQEGYYITGLTGDVMTCTEFGSWSMDVTNIACKAKECPALTVENGRSNTTQRTYGTVVVIECNTGYYLNQPQNSTIKCIGNGTWDTDTSSLACIIKECPELVTIQNGSWNTTQRTYDTVVQAQCTAGYYLNLPEYNSFRCTENGTWDKNASLVECVIVTCPPIPANDAGYPDTEVTTFGAEVNIICREGYVLPDPSASSVRCQANGSWSRNIAEIFCRLPGTDPPQIGTTDRGQQVMFDLRVYENQVIWLRQQGLPEICLVQRIRKAIPSNYSEAGNKYFVTYSCEEGYVFDDDSHVHRINCDKFGIWRKESDQLDNLNCKENSCPILELTPGTHRDSESHWFGDVVTYYCHAGYTFEDGSTRRSLLCLANKKWHTSQPVCRPVRCEVVDYHNVCKSAQLNETPSHNAHGDVVPLCCDTNYRLPDGRHNAPAVCNSGGKWKPELSSCTKSACDPLPFVDHSSYVLVERNSTHTIFTYRCDYGYLLENGDKENTLICSGQGWRFEDVKPCLTIACPRLASIQNADPDTDVTIWGTVVTVTCRPGYIVANRSSHERQQRVECLIAGYWNTSLDHCEEITCPAPDLLPRANLLYENTKLHSLANYTCQQGLRFDDGTSTKVVRCEENMQWSKIESSCEENRCPPPPLYKHAKYTNISVDVGTSSVLVCEDGYVFPSTDKQIAILCLANEQWSPLLLNCSPVDCGPLPLGDHMNSDNNDTVFLSTVTVSVSPYYMFTTGTNSVYHLEDNFTISNVTCLSNRTWSVDFTEINTTVVQCTDPPRVPYALPDRIKLPLYGGAEIGYRCADNYRFPDRTTWMSIHCLPDGTWETPQGCELITCPVLGDWQDMIIDPQPVNYTIGSVLNISCAEGYKMNNSLSHMFTKCVGLGDWKPQLTSCWKVDDMEIPVVESEKAAQVGLTLITVLVMLTGFIVVTDIISYRQAIHKLLLDVPSMPSNFVVNLKSLIRNINRLRTT